MTLEEFNNKYKYGLNWQCLATIDSHDLKDIISPACIHFDIDDLRNTFEEIKEKGQEFDDDLPKLLFGNEEFVSIIVYTDTKSNLHCIVNLMDGTREWWCDTNDI